MAKTTPRSQLVRPILRENRKLREEISREGSRDWKKPCDERHRLQERQQDIVIRRQFPAADPTGVQEEARGVGYAAMPCAGRDELVGM